MTPNSGGFGLERLARQDVDRPRAEAVVHRRLGVDRERVARQAIASVTDDARVAVLRPPQTLLAQDGEVHRPDRIVACVDRLLVAERALVTTEADRLQNIDVVPHRAVEHDRTVRPQPLEERDLRRAEVVVDPRSGSVIDAFASRAPRTWDRQRRADARADRAAQGRRARAAHGRDACGLRVHLAARRFEVRLRQQGQGAGPAQRVRGRRADDTQDERRDHDRDEPSRGQSMHVSPSCSPT